MKQRNLWHDGEIVEITRGHIRLAFAGRTATLQGEGYPAREGRPAEYEVYSKMLTSWDPPDHAIEIDDVVKQQILEAALRLLRERGMQGVDV